MTSDRWEQIVALFEATLRQPLPEREAFLARECGDDAELGVEVRELLVADGEAEGVLSRGRRPGAATVVDSRPVLPGLSAGAQLGVFRVESFIGAGGMGEVYKARDTRLDRYVAIKVLSPASATDPRGRARFAYEARAVGRLSHPRICALYDIGHHDGVDFLVMEYLQGETLAARLRRRTLPFAEALRIGVEIAEALDAAHAQGIVHRDLKPANVMITPDGSKLLDFGLARLRAAIGSDTAETFTRSQPEAGLIVGTLQYMSPEQLEGKDVDARTDIFAFGAVLYELVTGRKAFAGESQASLISAILSSEPLPIAGTQPLSPPSLDRLVRTCLEKDRDKRWASIHDVLLQLRWTAQEKPTGGAGTDSSSRKRVRAPWLVAAAAVLLGTSALLWSLRRPPVAEVSTRVLSLTPPFATTLATEEAPAISPDGKHLAFVGRDVNGRRLLYVQTLESYSGPAPLANTDGASMPFWKPDGRELGFFGQGKLKTVIIGSGQVRTLADAGGARGGSWNMDDVIVFVPAPGGTPYRISATGGDPTPVNVERAGWYPSFLPDGHHFLLFNHSNPQPDQAVVQLTSLDAMPPARIVPAKSNAIYVAPGYLVFWRDGTLLAQPFDATRRQAHGNAIALPGVAGLNPFINQALFSVSNEVLSVYYGGADGQTQLAWFDRSGNRLGTPGPTGIFNSLSLSPDESSVVYDEADPRTGRIDLQRFDFARGAPTRLTFHPSHDMFPVWSHDGARIAFNTLRDGLPNLYEVQADSPGNERALLKTPAPKSPEDYSSDGKFLLHTSSNPKTGSDIWVLPLDGKTKGYPVLNETADERQATLSPDGRWLAYISNESQSYQVYVQAFPISGFKRQVSSSAVGGFEPLWRRDGKELFYLAGDNTLMAVDVRSTPAGIDVGPPKPLFPTRIRLLEIQVGARHYVSSDGQRFLIANTTDEARSTPITVVVNWMSALTK